MPKNHEIKVDQRDGEISIALAGGDPKTYKVTDGEVTVEEADVERFLAVIDGSSLVGGSPAPKTGV